jgi:alkyl hydroperoxide reductase subunit AhpC
MTSSLRLTPKDSGYRRETDQPVGPRKSAPSRITIGQSAPRIGPMASIGGRFTYLDPTTLTARWIALCFLSSPTASNITYLNAQAEAFARDGAALLVVLSDISLLRFAQHEGMQGFTVPFLTDCLNRMHRSFGVAVNPPSATAVTFLIDPLRVLRFKIAHDLALRDLDGLRELLRMKRHSASESPKQAAETTIRPAFSRRW